MLPEIYKNTTHIFLCHYDSSLFFNKYIISLEIYIRSIRKHLLHLLTAHLLYVFRRINNFNMFFVHLFYFYVFQIVLPMDQFHLKKLLHFLPIFIQTFHAKISVEWIAIGCSDNPSFGVGTSLLVIHFVLLN